MNKQTFFILTSGLILSLSACKKTDIKEDLAIVDKYVAAAAAPAWRSVGSWSTTQEDASVIYNGSVTDTSLTAAIVADGLVLVYKKSGSEVQSLPVEEAGKFWYYQVSENTLEINCEGAESDDAVKQQTFQYILLSAEQVADLESKGHSRSDLMTLSHENARALLNN